MKTENKILYLKFFTLFRFIVLPIILLAFFLYIFYDILTFNQNHVLIFPFFLFFIILFHYIYGFFASIVITVIFCTIVLITTVFTPTYERFWIFVTVTLFVTCIYVLSKYYKRDISIKQRTELVFEMIDKDKTAEDLGYKKDTEQLLSLKDRLEKYYYLSNLANMFNGMLSRKEIYNQVILSINEIIVKSDIQIKNIDEHDDIFTKWVLLNNLPLLVRNLNNDYRFSSSKTTNSFYKSVIVVPIWDNGKISRLIKIGNPNTNIFREEDLRIINIISDLASIATTNRRLFKKVQDLVITDSLTNVYNKRYFKEICTEEFQRARKFEQEFSLIMLDIDFFKKYNDSYGHLRGDQILRAVSQVLKNNIRETDILARYGGEEFVLIFSMTDKKKALKRAEHLRNLIHKECCITVSIGLEDDKEKQDIYEMIEHADKALYKAKRTGRNKVCCF
ncbi:GGDEF domain-containing protein [bacterium]